MIGGWHRTTAADGTPWHWSTLAGGRLVGYVTRNDAEEWVTAAYVDPLGAIEVVGAGYRSAHAARMALNARPPVDVHRLPLTEAMRALIRL